MDDKDINIYTVWYTYFLNLFKNESKAHHYATLRLEMIKQQKKHNDYLYQLENSQTYERYDGLLDRNCD